LIQIVHTNITKTMTPTIKEFKDAIEAPKTLEIESTLRNTKKKLVT